MLQPVLLPVLLEHRPIGPGRAVEPDPVAHELDGSRHRFVVGAGAEEAATSKRELVSAATALGQARVQLGQDRGLQVVAGAEAMEADAVSGGGTDCRAGGGAADCGSKVE